MKQSAIFWSLSTLAATAACGAHAGSLWMGSLAGAQENPPVNVPYTGTGFLVLNDAETSASVTLSHNVPANIVTDGHIHRAAPGVNGPVIFPFPRGATTPAGISPVGPLAWAIPTAEVANLKNGLLYFNIHTQQNPAGAIRGQIGRVLFASAATDASQLSVANALDVSAGSSADLTGLMMGAALAGTSARAALLEDLSGRTIYAQGRQAVETMAGFEDNLFDHAEKLHLSAAEGAGLFAMAGQSFGKRDGGVGRAPSKVSRTAILAGFDHAWQGARVGLGVGHASGKDKFRSGVGETEAKTTSVQAFVSGGGGAVFTVAAGYGWTKFDTRRRLASIGRAATSSHDGAVWSLGAKVSAPMPLTGDVSMAPYGLIDVQQASIDGYAETGADSAGLVVAKHKEKNAAVEAGAGLTVPLHREGGGMTARLQAGWRYLLEDGGDSLATSLAGSPAAFQTILPSAGRSAAHLAASVTGDLGGNLSASAGYRGLIGSRGDIHAVQLRISLRM